MEIFIILLGITFGLLILVKCGKYNCSRNRDSAESEIGEIQDIDENDEYSENNNKENDKSDNSNQNINNNDDDDELPSYSDLYPK